MMVLEMVLLERVMVKVLFEMVLEMFALTDRDAQPRLLPFQLSRELARDTPRVHPDHIVEKTDTLRRELLLKQIISKMVG